MGVLSSGRDSVGANTTVSSFWLFTVIGKPASLRYATALLIFAYVISEANRSVISIFGDSRIASVVY